MARDLTRLTRDIQFSTCGQPGTAFRGFGADALYFSDDGQYLFLPSVALPEIFRQRTTPIVIVVPDGYGYGVPMTDVFVDAGLTTRRGKRPSRLFVGMDGKLPWGPSMSARVAQLARLVHYPGAIPDLATCAFTRRRTSACGSTSSRSRSTCLARWGESESCREGGR